MGETLHASTTLDLSMSDTNLSLIDYLLIIFIRESPATIIAIFFYPIIKFWLFSDTHIYL
jgi:hypothetical protein